MVILGLGANVGDRLETLRKALFLIKKIPEIIVNQVSPIYFSDALLPPNAPQEWDIPHLNLAIRCETTLDPLHLLKEIKRIEKSAGRNPDAKRWGPRTLDIDILAWDDLIIKNETLTIPHLHLLDRPFALWPLADVAPLWIFPLSGSHQGQTAAQLVEKWGSRFTGTAPLQTKQIYHRIDTPQLVGILNVTPDSFSDGNRFTTAQNALAQAIHLVNSGAEIIDIGAESTSPRAHPISPDTEWTRLKPVLGAIKKAHTDFTIPPKISIDTRHAEVAAKALALGVDWINDVTGLSEPAMREIVLHSKADCVVMHHKSIPERRNNVLPRDQDPIAEILSWAESCLNQLENQGIVRERIIFDPGIGFGKMAEQSLWLLKNIRRFEKLNTRLLIGHSRKTFLSLLTALPFTDRDVETMAMALALAKHPVNYLRVHNVEICARGFRVAKVMEDF